MIKVLLISPTDPKKPGDLRLLVGGENTYSQTLINKAPEGVIYTYHMDALKKGLISYLPIHYFLRYLVKLRILPLSAGTEAIKINADFDLVHCHGYSVKIVSKKKIPIVMSDSSSNYLFLRDYVFSPEWRIRIGYFLRQRLFRWLGVIDCDTNWQEAKKIVVLSKFAERVHQKLGVPDKKIKVVYPGISVIRNRGSWESKQSLRSSSLDRFGTAGLKGSRGNGVNILFVGIWFERKGGPMVLAAFKKLSLKYKNIKLTIVGPIPDRDTYNGSRVTHYDFLPREKLMREIFPKADIFVLVPPVAEGFGFAVLEAMALGIPAVVSNVYALPELVDDKKTGFVIEPGNLDHLVTKLETLIANQKLRAAMGKAAREKFEENFSIKKLHYNLLKVYREVLS